MSDSAALLASLAQPKVAAPLDPGFQPAALVMRAYDKMAREAGREAAIALERPDGTTSVFRIRLLPEGHPQAALNLPYVERLVKLLLWQKGGYRVTLAGMPELLGPIRSLYSAEGARSFDYDFMGQKLYERPMEIVACSLEQAPAERETSKSIGRHLEGCRIGFDLGASDRKVAAVIDGREVFSEEVVWTPRDHDDPEYHFSEIDKAFKTAAPHMPRVDAIGGSSAGVIVNNRVMAASLFRGVTDPVKFERVKGIFLELGKKWGVPIEVANDGDVTALAGSMSLDAVNVLGIAMGSSEAAGYVNHEGSIMGWLNELAFAPIDYRPDAPADEWSGDTGCGVQYLTQQAVFRLAPTVGIPAEGDTLASRLKSVQGKLEAGHEGARQIWETIGVYCGYAIAHYANFYTIDRMLVLGRVTSGSGGPILVEKAEEVLRTEFPELASRIQLSLPDEKMRRVGQAVAAASLPVLRK